MNNKVLTEERLNVWLFILLFFLYSFVFMTKQCFNAAMADIVNEGVLTKSQTGLIVSVFFLVYAPLQIVGGACADKFDNKKLILIGLLGAGTVNAVIFFFPRFYVMLVSWGFSALAQFALWPSIVKIISTVMRKEYRQKSIMYMSMSSSLGAVFAYLTAVVISRWQYNFAVSACVLFITAVIFYYVYTYMEGFMQEDEEEKKPLRRKSRQGVNVLRIVLASGVVLVAAFSLSREIVLSGMKGFAPVIMMESYEHITPALGNTLNIIVILFGTLGVILSRVLFPKFIKTEFWGMGIMLALATVVSVSFLFLGKAPIGVFVLALALANLLITTSVVFMNSWILSFHEYGCEGTVIGIINGSAALGIVLESYGLAIIAERSGWFSVMLLWLGLLAACLLLIFIAAMLWKRFLKKNPKN